MNVFNYVTFVVNVKVILFFVVQQFEFTSRHCTTNFHGGGGMYEKTTSISRVWPVIETNARLYITTLEFVTFLFKFNLCMLKMLTLICIVTIFVCSNLLFFMCFFSFRHNTTGTNSKREIPLQSSKL